MIDLAPLRAANAPINAFVEWDEGARSGPGPLAGVTIGIKANIAVKGLAWTAGLAAHRARIADRDAAAVALLRAAGAAIIGTLNLDEGALGAATRNPHFGWTHNPHALDRTPGGSSGGSGAAVAAGLCDAALGSDTMGSIRLPAAYCGVYAFKPANDRVSRDGLEPAEPTLDCIGPLARSLDMLERVAAVISPIGDDGEAAGVATLAGLGGVECEPAVLAGYDRARDIVRPGAELRLDQPLSRIRFGGFVRTARTMGTHLGQLDPAGITPALHQLLSHGARRREADWAEDRAILAATAAAVRAAVADGTLLMLPTAPQAAFADHCPAPASQADFTCLANIAGLPAISLPSGVDADGLPVAVQLIGAAGREAGLFRAARALDAALGAYRRPRCFFDGGK